MATIRDVAARAEVSVATVSAVLNRSRVVSPDLMNKVLRAIEELDYSPNRLARALKKERTNYLACLVPTIENPFFPKILKTVEDVAFDSGFGLFVCSSEGRSDRARQYQKMLIESQIDGVVVWLRSEFEEHGYLKTFLDAGIAVVGMSGGGGTDDFDCVLTDEVGGGFYATTYLVSLGHTRIGFIGVCDDEVTDLRLRGYKKALLGAGLPVSNELVQVSGNVSEADGYACAKALISKHPDVTALFVYNDYMAQGVLSALHDSDVKVPSQVSVIGFDDSVGLYTTPRLSTMAIPKAEMARLATSLLIERIRGNTEPRRCFTLPTSIVIRESTAPIPRA